MSAEEKKEIIELRKEAALLRNKYLEEELAEKDNQLAEKDGKLAEKDGKLAEKDGKLAEKDGKLAEKDDKLAKKDSFLARFIRPLLKTNSVEEISRTYSVPVEEIEAILSASPS